MIGNNFLTIKDIKNNLLYEKNFNSSTELIDFIDKYKECRAPYSFVKGIFLPLRTNCLKNFACDFFLPSFTSIALQEEKKKYKILLAFPTILFDLQTLVIRVATLFFRLIYNAIKKEKPHTIESLFHANKNLKKIIQDGVIIINYGTKKAQSSTLNEVETQNNFNPYWSAERKVYIRKVPSGCFKTYSSANFIF